VDFKELINKKFFQFFFFTALIVTYYSVFVNVAEFSNTAYFGGDEYGYQSMGVNFAYGHGVQKVGGIEDFEKYKFAPREKISGELLEFNDMNFYFFYRTPAYPLFLGLIYKIVGVQPIVAKYAQLLLLALIAGLLPLVGRYYWGGKGFISGLIAGPVYLAMNYKFSENLLTESLVSFSVFLLVLAYINFDIRKSKWATALLGLSCGFCLLVKGSLLFLPILISAYFCYLFYRSRDKEIIRKTALFLGVFAVTVLPWSLYASIKSGSLILISTQGKAVLLDTNNEYAKGRWHPEWKRDENSFYKNDNLEDAPPIFRVMNYYFQNPARLPVLLWKKTLHGYFYLLPVWILLFIFFMESYLGLLKRILASNLLNWFFIVMTCSTVGLIVYYWSKYIMADVHHFYSVLSADAIVRRLQLFLMLLVIILPALLNRFHRTVFSAPPVFIIIFLNFFIVTLLTCADHAIYPSRYVKVMDFILILTTVHYLSNFLGSLAKPAGVKLNN